MSRNRLGGHPLDACVGHFHRSVVLFPPRLWLLLLSVLAIPIPPVHAQGVGLQGGFTVDPEQGFVGSHLETGEISPDFRLRPGIDGGFGGDFILASIHVDFVYTYSLGGVWSIYQGGGPAIYIYRFDEPASTFTEVTGGVTGLFGFTHDNGFFFETRVGSRRGPVLTFGIGVTVR